MPCTFKSMILWRLVSHKTNGRMTFPSGKNTQVNTDK